MSITILKKEVWSTRWHLRLGIKGWELNREFYNWMQENCSECMCVRRWNGTNPYWEVRGGDRNQLMLIIMRWVT